jgi:hypothetical protein
MSAAGGSSASAPLAILVHGMGRTPLSMALLAGRLRRRGFRIASFGYVAALESHATCLARLQRFIHTRIGAGPYIVVGHSLGAVLLRGVLPRLARRPAACFLIAAPATACVWARRLANSCAYRIVTGEMGQLLADADFLHAVPIPDCPTWIYAGTAGPRHRRFVLADEPNDGILKISETQLAGIPSICVPALHTFIMNSRLLTRDLLERAHAVLEPAPAAGR